MRTRAYGAVVALMLVGAPAAGQVVLSEAEALARLSPDSPRVRTLRSTIGLAEADVLAAGRLPNPVLTVAREQAGGVAEVMSTVLQPLAITGVHSLERQAAGERLGAVTRRADEGIRRARADLRLAFADLVAAQTGEATCAEVRERLTTLAQVLARREAAGDAAGFDRLRVEREVIEVNADCDGAAATRVRAQGELASFFTAPLDPSSLVAAATRTGPIAWPATAELLARAERARGELAALAHERDAARLSLQAAARRRVPQPEVLAGTKSTDAVGGDVGFVFGMQAVLPLFDHGGPERALALARASQVEVRSEAFRQALRAQVATLRSLAVARREAADRYRAAAAPSADEVARIAQVSYEAGERSIVELLDAVRTAAAARFRQSSLDAAARQSEIELEFVSGWEIP